ncbi:hypothetical protein N8I77_009395 [Diaporthe amygdali]|uniref:Clock-controlled protein 8 n=1 Tax=Phomopsis amygdali TaxID=1214568 RepID=A0AAD9S9P7_PHOAM|nr:hypothetical protein N8I77_009395 [Diaporthe amygdali]
MEMEMEQQHQLQHQLHQSQAQLQAQAQAQTQSQNHMRLPPPVDFDFNGIGNGNATHGATDPLFHKSLQQLQPPPEQAHSSSLTLSPPYTNASASPFYASGGSNNNNHSHQHQSHRHSESSSLSPRPLSQLPAYSPPSYAFAQQNHDPTTLNFPQPPSNELAPLQLNPTSDHGVNSLPSLAYLAGPPTSNSLRFASSSAASDTSFSPPVRPRPWPTGNPYSAYYSGGHAQSAGSPAKMDLDSLSSGTRGPLSPEPIGGRASSVSLDDPDVRMAAEALGDLKADFVSSPKNKNTPMPNSPSNMFGTPGPPEPLLSLVMTSGSVLAKPIEGTVSAYNTTKNFSPGFIKTPVDYIEGVVGSGLHLTGIEGGVRWFFRGKGRHQSSGDLETGEKSHKRRKVGSRGNSTSTPRRDSGAPTYNSANGADAHGQMDPYGFTTKDRRLSMSTIDTLPAYDDARSPAYTEDAVAPNDKSERTASRPSSTTPTAWQSRLIMSTSGLSIAMSEESLRSLKYCLSWLRWANDHIGRVISALKDALDKYESHPHLEDHAMNDTVSMSGVQDDEQARRAIGARIDALRTEVLKTLQGVIETVSKYAGGALPDNARALVRRHLTSLPQRFRIATQESGSNANGNQASSSEEGKEQEVRDGAQRVLVLAKEGLDMMSQVSGVLDGTIVSAEEWCDRLGRKKRDHQPAAAREGDQQQHQQQQSQTVPFAGVGVDGDVKMG